MSSVFDCNMCGQCCEGKGGIVVSPFDLKRICEHLAISTLQFTKLYACMENNKLKVRTGEDNFCIFFKHQAGCTIHKARPNICRAWPFFRGNMLDSESFYLAKDYCPGISASSTHEEFVTQGRIYLKENNLHASDVTCEAHALIALEQEI